MKHWETIFQALRRENRILLLIGLSSFVLIAVADLVTPETLDFTPFYFLPIMALAWSPGRAWPWIAAGAGALVWPSAHLALGNPRFFLLFTSYWNTAVRFACLSAVAVSVAALRRAFDRQGKANDEVSRALHETRVAEQRYREVFDYSSNGILVFDVGPGLRCKVAALNPAAQRLLGLTAKQAIGRPVEELLSPAAADTVMGTHRRTFDAGYPLVFDGEIDLPSGHRHVHTTQIPVREPGGAWHRLITLPLDTTEKVAAEQALRESEQRYREVFENATDGLCLIDVTSDHRLRVAGINQAMERMLAQEDAEVRNRFFDELFLAETAGQMKAHAEQCLAEGIPLSREGEISLPIGTFWWHTTLAAVRDTTGRICRLIVVATDLTEKRRVETALRDMQSRQMEHERQLFQAAKLASLGTLVSGIAHEINNPNNFIRLNSQALAGLWPRIRPILDTASVTEGGLSPHGLQWEKEREMVGSLLSGIVEGSRRIEKLILNLRDFARGEESDLRESVEVNAVIDSAVMIVGDLIRKSTDSFTIQKAAGLPEIRGSYQQIEQVVINLVTNACQSLPSREREVSVVTLLDDGGATVRIEVADRGVGIPAEHLARVTDPFFTTKRTEGGSGLGLAVSSRIVTNHGGTMSFDSRAGNGTRVTVRLPAGGSTA